ncbi:MAG TPA: PAS domain-containing protein, partial [Methanoregula sp.]|nr:PAS domain-containing protein [Methanoregula sp.]
KKAELRVEESERQFRLLAENSLDMIGRIKPDFTHMYASPAYTTTLGYFPEEVIGKPGRLFIHPDDVHIMESARTILTEQNSSGTLRFRSKHKDGHYVWVESHVRSIFDEKTHDVSEYYTVTRDISEQKTAEEALQESEDRYRKLVEISPDAVFLHRNGKIIYANPATFTLLGATRPDEIIGKSVLDFVSPEFKDIVRENIQKDLQAKVSPRTELHMVRIDGTPIIIEGRGIATEINGKPAVQVAIRDITEQNRAEEELCKSQGLYHNLAESSSDLIFVIGRDDRVEYANSFASSMVTKPMNQIIGHPRSSLFPAEASRTQKIALETVFETGSSVRNTGPLTVNGQLRWFDHILIPLKDTGGKIQSVLGISRDITDRKNTEETLIHNEQRFRNLINAVGDIVWEIDAEARFVYVSPQVEAILGYTPDELIGHTPFEFLHPDTIPQNHKKFRNASEGQVKSIIHESQWIHKDGHMVTIESNAIKLFDSNGSFSGFIGIDRKRP